MRIAATGYVSEEAGSVASANALLLRGLLERGIEITFFSKASFVDPRPAVGDHAGFAFVDVDNRIADRVRARLSRIPVARGVSGAVDTHTYHRLLVRQISEYHARGPFALVLWLGEYARGRVEGIPSVSFAQGPPGTDARSVLNHYDEIRRLTGPLTALRWRGLAQLRLSPAGLPPLRFSDQILVGSEQSRQTLITVYGRERDKIHALPYPIDLETFRVAETIPAREGMLRCLWLGRIIPRKRLDLFLDGAAGAIRDGVNLRLTIAGGVGFIPGYEKLIRDFPYPSQLDWRHFVPRAEVPALLHDHDVLVQPSEEENFGSSVAEAQACGLPVIVGRTNGNADYLADGDIRLADDDPRTLTEAIKIVAGRKASRTTIDEARSRACAEKHFAPAKIADRLADLLKSFARS
ncbi:glycosyltransferase [Terrimicrobium sacchariphilum]|jgi:glycosyltransferase involved in cell wall biosynthesis|uniref:Glycosyltransferase n=1 Tax=Terrimicrobium sacchariphilum TaxID=690879 RepID=A0A146GG10_TERSA|nr:glycosyltransferase family 4 protein [Terrimicrobium sacchariphilum]GAT35366.1 glycosyltransferase [Terrimicrobium sacchariphilum]